MTDNAKRLQQFVVTGEANARSAEAAIYKLALAQHLEGG